MLKENTYIPFTAQEIVPTGWLRQQLEIQAAGLSGNLDKIWPDVQDSRWVGGDREGWERVPYWLDGFIPLAFLLRDQDMINRAQRYMDAILAGQQEDGWICPCTQEERGRYDMWALMLIGKVMALYADCTGDPEGKIEESLYRALKQFCDHVHGNTLFGWGLYRWFECLIPIYWIYERRPEDWLLDLAIEIYSQGVNFRALFENWRDQEPENRWGFQNHVVNLAMAYKVEALISRLVERVDNDSLAQLMYDTLQKYHGMAVGHFTGDECLAGDSPIQGSELCSVVEAMYSFETIFAAGGKVKWLDRLEQLAYNALPAACSPDMWTHQYDQQTNQIACYRMEQQLFLTNSPESNRLGLEPNYGCCTANFNQGWPKFALATFYRSKNGIVSAALAPASVAANIGDANVTVELQTLYPFRDTLTYVVTADKPVTFDLGIRIPGFVAAATVDGQAVPTGEIHTVTRTWQGVETVEVRFTMEFAFVQRPRELVALRRGPLFWSVAIEEEWVKNEYEKDGVQRKFPYCDYDVLPKSKWNYAFAGEDFTLQENDDYTRPFDTANGPLSMTGKVAEIDWGTQPGYSKVAAREPQHREPMGEPVTVKFLPYGCTTLRMTELPRVK